jgi:hypothetical protein
MSLASLSATSTPRVSFAASMAATVAASAAVPVEGIADGTARITATVGVASGIAEITVQNPDRAVLVALYEATDGPNWRDDTNWLSDAPLGDWYGVETNASGRVVRLDHSVAHNPPPQVADTV